MDGAHALLVFPLITTVPVSKLCACDGSDHLRRTPDAAQKRFTCSAKVAELVDALDSKSSLAHTR